MIAWHQSRIAQYLRCPRCFALEHVEGCPIDHAMAGYAAPLGTAMHQGIETVLRGVGAEGPFSREFLYGILESAFLAAVARAQDRGHATDPDTVERALERLLGEKLDQLVRFQDDPRLRAVEWVGIEQQFEWSDRHGRTFRGTIDAVGRARGFVRGFAVDGRDTVDLHPGDLVCVDWKTGTEVPLGWVSRSSNVQLAFYKLALARIYGGQARTFLGKTEDLNTYKRPRDESGNPIKSKLKSLSPAWLAATGLTEADAQKSKKRPKDAEGAAILKWIEEPNPAFVEACNRPRGPLFHEARIDMPAAVGTIRAVIQAAELGLFPASGAQTDQCRRCPFRGACVHDTQTKEEETE